MTRLVLLQKRAMRISSKSCYDAHTEPTFKNFCISPPNDTYIVEIGKIVFQYKTGLLPDVFNNTFLRRNQVQVMIPGMPVPFMFLSAELT